jgi:putative peptidoglycan lipid II flippase
VWALPSYGVHIAAWVTVARGLAQTLLLLPALGSYCRPDWASATMHKMWLRLRPLFLGTVYYKTSPLVDRFLSSMVPAGGLSLFFLGHQICGALNDIISKAITGPMVSLCELVKLPEGLPTATFLGVDRNVVRIPSSDYVW